MMRLSAKPKPMKGTALPMARLQSWRRVGAGTPVLAATAGASGADAVEARVRARAPREVRTSLLRPTQCRERTRDQRQIHMLWMTLRVRPAAQGLSSADWLLA